MKNLLRGQRGFSLIEVVAAAAIIGIMATMLLPSLSGANDRVKNAKLNNDLATIDQAIQLYRLDAGKAPEKLADLDKQYLSGKLEFKDAKGEALSYSVSADSYYLSGKDTKGATITSPGSTGSAPSSGGEG